MACKARQPPCLVTVEVNFPAMARQKYELEFIRLCPEVYSKKGSFRLGVSGTRSIPSCGLTCGRTRSRARCGLFAPRSFPMSHEVWTAFEKLPSTSESALQLGTHWKLAPDRV